MPHIKALNLQLMITRMTPGEMNEHHGLTMRGTEDLDFASKGTVDGDVKCTAESDLYSGDHAGPE